MMESVSSSYIQQEWALFQLEPWGDEWRPIATWIASNLKNIDADQLLKMLLSAWNHNVKDDEQADSDIYSLLERTFGGGSKK